MLCCCLPFKPARVVFLGLDGSGKTTLFNHLAHHLSLPPAADEGAVYVPTKLPMVATCQAHGRNLVVWDVPGSDPQTWRHFYTGAMGIVYVVDADRFAQAKQQLEELGREEQLKDALFLLVVNKQSASATTEQIMDKLKHLPFSRYKVMGSAQEFASVGVPWLCKEM
ncbi:hypothetical protein BASA81_001250 [Batrachochytrium salamandrivorans]|nr:hypothetical protein BASA81_001250 [Batrachochytrium salamandrivorans]